MDESSKQLVRWLRFTKPSLPLKHGIWLNIAEIELSALNSQCLKRRIASIDLMRREVSAWQRHRNQRGAPIRWRFTTEDARIKLLRLYPKL